MPKMKSKSAAKKDSLLQAPEKLKESMLIIVTF